MEPQSTEGEQLMNTSTKYPVEVSYKFSEEISIREEQLPFVKISILTDNIPDETIEFFPNVTTDYNHSIWYIYGDSTLLYAGVTIKAKGLSVGIGEDERFTAKYIGTENFSKYPVYWDSNKTYTISWELQNDDKYRLWMPSEGGELPLIDLPYANITVKRNTGITAEEANDINPSFNVPVGHTYPNLQKTNQIRRPSTQNTTSKIWLKTGVNKYRLIVYGRFCKWTDKQVITGGDYLESTYNYSPYLIESDIEGLWNKYYKLDSYTEEIKNTVLHGATSNPSNIRLLINYVNNSGQNEVRKYEIKT